MEIRNEPVARSKPPTAKLPKGSILPLPQGRSADAILRASVTLIHEFTNQILKPNQMIYLK